jgi:alpha-maltose-1-phosphate synthase
LKSLFLTNEYPPNVYGGAGVHVDYLTRELAKLIDVEVRSFGNQDEIFDHLRVRGFGLDTAGWTAPNNLHSIFGAVRRCTDFNTAAIDADLVHCHTWYTHLGGILAKLNYGIPLVITSHSLEPLRPWKREQLGGGYDFSCWVERTAMQMADAVIAVSREGKSDIQRLFEVPSERIHIIYNGIDTVEYHPVTHDDALLRYGIDPAVPFILFVGRIARQKGIIHLVNAIRDMDPGFQVVLCAGAPDTPEIAEEMQAAVAAAQAARPGVIWIQEMVNKATVFQLYSHAAIFVCPSIYEPFGIINLEAMACETPVVASAVGGIKEVVVDGETGFLVPLDQLSVSPFEPVNPDRFAHDLAAKINLLMSDPDLRVRFGKAGRRRAEQLFSWKAIARQTLDLYQLLVR